MLEVVCVERCLGPWDAAFPGETRLITEGEIFKTDCKLSDLPRYLVVTSSKEAKAHVEAKEDEVVEAPMTLGDASGDGYRVMAALRLLDPDKDDHWTEKGLPNVEAVNAALQGGPKVSRAEIHNTAPDFYRPA